MWYAMPFCRLNRREPADREASSYVGADNFILSALLLSNALVSSSP
jgi:hypothetical protein